MLRKRWAGVFYYLYCRIVSPAFADIPPGSFLSHTEAVDLMMNTADHASISKYLQKVFT